MRSGSRHKLGNHRIIEVMADAGEPSVVGDQLHYVGTDSRGVEPEVIAVPDDRQPRGPRRYSRAAYQLSQREGPQTMIKPTEYVVTEDDTVADVDLDSEVVRLKDGRRLTSELADRLAAEASRRNLVPGRKSLTGGSAHSPRVQFRLPDALRLAAEKRAG